MHNCMGQIITYEKRYRQLCEREEELRHQLAAAFGPDYKCGCAEYEHTGDCHHMDAIRELQIEESLPKQQEEEA